MAGHVIERKRKDGSVIYRINRKTQNGVYKINPDSWQRPFIKEIRTKGFEALPTGLYKDGRGLTAAGGRLAKRFHGRYGDKLKITVAREEGSTIKKYKTTVRVVVNHKKLRAVNAAYRNIRAERGREIKAAIIGFLKSTFPEEFGEAEETFTTYAPGTLARVLSNPDVAEDLSPKDRQALREFYPRFVKSLKFSLKSTKNIRFAKEGSDVAKTVYLEKVVREYEQKLQKQSGENVWQKFLKQHILLLLHSYAAVIEKQSVDIDGKFPDFMLVDPYGYLDIYEIKKPQTRLLNHDGSRDNYYWAADVSKAISQVENYIDHTTHHWLEIADKVRRKEGREVKIVRPRGFVIAGMRTQLGDEAQVADFRILNDSLKNIDIILYDDLLENIRTLLNRFSEDGAKKAARKSLKKAKKGKKQ